MALRWGIAGVGKISNDFVRSLKCSPKKEQHEIVGDASRSIERSKEFADIHGISNYYESYQDLARDDAVEIVYVTVLNPFHYEVCLLMLQHEKHILCEKPFCMNSWQTKHLLDIAKSKNLFIMEGLWSRFFPAYRHLKELIKDGSLGEVREIYIKHGFRGENVDRVIKKEMGGGVLLDIGVYAIQFVLFCFQDEAKSVKAKGKKNSGDVDCYFEAEIGFSGGRMAKIICSGMDEYENQAVVITTKGTLCVPQYWCPTSIVELDGNVKTWPLVKCKDKMNFINSEGLHYEADEVLKCIRSGKLYCDVVTPKDTLDISMIEDEIRKLIGVRYDCDKL